MQRWDFGFVRNIAIRYVHVTVAGLQRLSTCRCHSLRYRAKNFGIPFFLQSVFRWTTWLLRGSATGSKAPQAFFAAPVASYLPKVSLRLQAGHCCAAVAFT